VPGADVKAPDFAWLRASCIDEAVDALVRYGEDAAVLAGGQSLMAMLNLRAARAEVLVDINHVPGLDAVRDAGDALAIGARARYAQLESSMLVREHLPLIAQALPHVAHPAVRSRGTLGGSLALADPAAEMPACCLALGARVVLAGPSGRREVAMEDWFRGLYETALAPGELVVEVRIPKTPPGTTSRFLELARRRGDFAVAGVALTATLRDGALHAPRLALLGVSDRPVLAHGAMRRLDGVAPGDVGDDALAAILDQDAAPLDDPQCPADYRRHALHVLVRRALATAA
jgi:carbon-monoxide dehydrogenase medium subunit